MKNIIFLCIALTAAGCGVKGDPLPPERAAEMGRGRPTYRRATERVRVAPQKSQDEDRREDEDGSMNE